MTTSTWRPRSKARCSATVSAMRGVTIRSTIGSSAVLRSSARSPRAERSSSASRTAVGVGVRHADRGEDDGERLVAGARLRRDLGGELEVRQAADREDRQLLAAHERGEPVDRGDAGEDRVARRVPRAPG